MYLHVVALGVYIEQGRRRDGELQTLEFVVELHQRRVRGPLALQHGGVEVVDLPDEQHHRIGVDEHEPGELQALRHREEIRQLVAVEERGVHGHEKRDYHYLGQTPEHIVPAPEHDYLAQHAENQPGDRQYAEYYAAQHQEVEEEALPAYLIELLYREGVVERAEADEEGREQQHIEQMARKAARHLEN